MADDPAPRSDACQVILTVTEPRMLSDPRVFFAAERTLLAWVRTGLTIMAFGFVVARFGLFLRIVRLQQSDRLMETTPQGLANVVGVALVLIGSACMVLAAVQ